MKLSNFKASTLVELAHNVLGVILASLLGLVGLEIIGDLYPRALPALRWFLKLLVRLSSDDYAGPFIGDRLIVFTVISIAFVLWVTHKWPTLVKTIGQALNPFARLGVAALSASAAVLVALILAGPLGQSKSEGECASSFRLSVDDAPSLMSNTTCRGKQGHAHATRD